MHLYGSTASPFVQRVLMTARAKRHGLEVRKPLGGHMKSVEFRAISPMGRIPVLAFDDGQHLCESAAIAAYLDETLDGPSLMPGNAFARARVREIAAIADAEIATPMRVLMVHLVFKMGDAPQVVEAAGRQLEGGLDALDRLLDATGPFATGATITAADCALVPMLALMRVTGPMTGVWDRVQARPAVAGYAERVFAEPVPRRSVEDIESAFAEILARNAAG